MTNDVFTKFSESMNYSKANLSAIVVSYVKHKILSGELKSGDKLVETDVSEELQISRAPVREAIRELNMQGILFFSPRKGSQVLEMTYNDIAEIFSIRIPLEMQVLTIIFENNPLTEEDLNHLEELNNEMIRQDKTMLFEREKLYQFNRHDLLFHEYLWKKSGSLRRAQILESQFYQLLTAMNQDVTTLGSIQEKYEEHCVIIEACRSGSLEKTLAAFQKHMDSYLKVVKEL